MTEPARDAEDQILVVDDDAQTRGLLAMRLRRSGFHVLLAASGEAALSVIGGEAVSLVVLDVGLSGMSGTDVVRALREQPHTATLPVILLTGGGRNSLVAGLGAGADDYLEKPVQLDELVARVRAHLRSNAAWSSTVEDELRRRSAVVAGPQPSDALAGTRGGRRDGCRGTRATNGLRLHLGDAAPPRRAAARTRDVQPDRRDPAWRWRSWVRSCRATTWHVRAWVRGPRMSCRPRMTRPRWRFTRPTSRSAPARLSMQATT